MKIKNIIFDFGGVILKHKKDIMEEFISEIFSIPLGEAFKVWKENKIDLVTGKITSKKFLLKLKKKFKTKLTLEQLLQMWQDLYVKEAKDVNQDLLAFIERLKLKYRVYLFTDTVDVHDKYNSKRGIYQKFLQVFKSSEEGLVKADKAAFTNVLDKIKAKPEECIFIDDLESNVNNAKSLGIKGIVFKNNKQLKEKLKQLIEIGGD